MNLNAKTVQIKPECRDKYNRRAEMPNMQKPLLAVRVRGYYYVCVDPATWKGTLDPLASNYEQIGYSDVNVLTEGDELQPITFGK